MPEPLHLADEIAMATEALLVAAREFKTYSTVRTFARVIGAFANLATIIKAHKRPMREWLVTKDEKARR